MISQMMKRMIAYLVLLLVVCCQQLANVTNFSLLPECAPYMLPSLFAADGNSVAMLALVQPFNTLCTMEEHIRTRDASCWITNLYLETTS